MSRRTRRKSYDPRGAAWSPPTHETVVHTHFADPAQGVQRGKTFLKPLSIPGVDPQFSSNRADSGFAVTQRAVAPDYMRDLRLFPALPA